MLNGMMMDQPLLLSSVIEYAAETHPHAQIVSARVEGDIHSYGYAEARARIIQLAHALRDMGVQPGDRVATLAWNTHRHFELYYAIAGIGAVCHTINPRLFPDQLTYIANHAEDQVMFFDTTFAPLVAELRAQWPEGMKLVALCDASTMPTIDGLADTLCYEALLKGRATTIDWPQFDENTAAALCYTSGTTGEPKGALYSHRSNVLHSLFCIAGGFDSLGQGRRIMPVVPLFHANSWGLTYSAALAGSSIVFPGAKLDGESVFALMDSQEVYSSWGVPTVWLGLIDAMKKHGRKPNGLSEIVVGGSAASRSMIETFERDFGVNVIHAWGMTEMSPIGTLGKLEPDMEARSFDQRMDLKATQGRRMYGVDLKIVDEAGARLPHDGEAFGELFVRGPAVIRGYYNNEEATKKAFDAEGWFGTGDVAKITPEGFLVLVDRTKDLVKSGGEWISSIDVENAASAHPGVANCAVIGIPHPKWVERPLLIVVPRAGAQPDKASILALLATSLAKWQMPNDVVFVDEIPLTATGKISKMTLRERFKDHEIAD
ncbi:MAG: long-chain-fatty-acid--CoA ligase [Pseudomonadota bacterium]